MPRGTVHFITHISGVIHHFEEHAKHEHINVFTFLLKHAKNAKHLSQEHHDHDTLPGNHKYLNDFQQIRLIAFSGDNWNAILFTPGSGKHHCIQNSSFTLDYSHAIWQPPRAAA